jgi:uncharacterized protein YjiK
LVVGVVGVCGVALTAAGTVAQTPRNPLDRYVLDEPTAVVRLSWRLREISGLARTPDGRLFAHDDERAVVYELDSATGELVKGFAMGDQVARDDFEGIGFTGGRFYLVSSTGRLYESREGEDDERLLFNTYGTGVGRACEIEGLAHDPGEDLLLLLCKTALVEELAEFVTIFRWSPASRKVVDPPIRIPLGDVERATGQRGFAASGIARDPVTGSYVLISGPDRAIVAVTPEGEVLGGGRLDRDRHPQAEGIAFGSDGSLLIADEGRDGRARITTYTSRD